jgi:pimeloyl-ACP methyl ester carboxylesterase
VDAGDEDEDRIDEVAGVSLRHERVVGDGGVGLHVVTAGEGPAVVLLHGFPEDWRTWRRQIGPLVRAGFSTWAVDLRGYHRSDRPAGRAAYRLGHLVGDVAAVVRAAAESTGRPRAHVVGHDWGGIIAWAFAGAHPEMLDRLVILNAPHMGVYLGKLWRTSQWWRSGYVGFFQLPVLPERVLSAANFRLLRRAFDRLAGRPGAYGAAEVEGYVRAMAEPGALAAAINYYRANVRRDAMEMARSARTRAETLVIWGERDPALVVELLDGLERFAPRVRVQRIPEAGHWVQNEAAGEVARVMGEFLSDSGGAFHHGVTEGRGGTADGRR